MYNFANKRTFPTYRGTCQQNARNSNVQITFAKIEMGQVYNKIKI